MRKDAIFLIISAAIKICKARFVHLFLYVACTFAINPVAAQHAQPSLEWTGRVPGTTGDEIAYSIQQTTDGGYIVAGKKHYSNGSNSGENYMVWKLSGNGEFEWTKRLGDIYSGVAYSVQQTADGGYIAAGNLIGYDSLTGATSSDYYIVKLNGSGDITWEKMLGGSGWDIAYSIQQTTDGGYIIAGVSDSEDGDITGNRGHWIVKLNSTGSIAWQKSLEGVGQFVTGTSILQTTDGEYVFAGSARFNGDDCDFLVVKLNITGNIIWQKTLEGTGDDYCHSIEQTTDGGYIVAGETRSDQTMRCWGVKLDDDGRVQWQKTYYGGASTVAHSIRQTTDGGYIMAGEAGKWSEGDFPGTAGNSSMVAKLDAVGNIQWYGSYGSGDWGTIYSIQETVDGGYVFAGRVKEQHTPSKSTFDGWIAKLGKYGTGIEADFFSEFYIYPNPATNIINIAPRQSEPLTGLRLVDLSGKVVATYPANTTQINVTGMGKGIYVLALQCNEDVYYTKVLIE